MTAFQMYKRLGILGLILLQYLCTNSTNLSLSRTNYFQQRVDYEIHVKLNDKKHTLSASVKIEYTNHSPDTLRMLYFHLWPNAYKDTRTAFAQQLLQNGDLRFQFSSPEDRGYIDSLEFRVNGDLVGWEYDYYHIDIARIYLDKPLAPGERITITTPFKVKIPASFSRLGHVGQSYQITQWYPKPAVYDASGWHPMPYLDQGEFYSEFGSYTVHINVPRNYVVGATGKLQTPSELEWLNEKAELTRKLTKFPEDMDFPESSPERKIITYYQDSIHDFAWFADKRYHVLKGEVTLPHSGRKVTTWAMFTNIEAHLWKNSIEYINNAIYYYSRWLGDYPYTDVTAVEGALSAGGGMEYPMITIIGKAGNSRALETVIVHEVGHNWFYGILGSDERTHPWMDEGINSFYEYRVMSTLYPDMTIAGYLNAEEVLAFFDLDEFGYNWLNYLLYQTTASLNKDQPLNLPATAYTYINYGTMVYAKTALALRQLMAYLGEERFDSIMQAYYATWQFKHPSPEDFRRCFITFTGDSLDWFFKDLLQTTKKIDYKIQRVNDNRVTIVNKGQIVAPFTLTLFQGDSTVMTYNDQGFPGKKTINLPSTPFDRVRIDADEYLLEINRNNNTWQKKGIFNKTEPFRLQLLGSIDHPYKTQLFFFPVAGWNNYDKSMLGVSLYNHLFPFKKFEFDLAPLFATATKTLTGWGELRYHWHKGGKHIQRVTLAGEGKRFSYQLFGDHLTYSKFAPRLEIEFQKPEPRSRLMKSFSARHVRIWQDVVEYDFVEMRNKKTTTDYWVNDFSFTLENKRILRPYAVTLTAEHGSRYLKTSITGRYQITYKKKNSGLNLRLFAGTFLIDNRNAGDPDVRFRLAQVTGTGRYQKDYLFDEFFLGRNETSGIFSQQIALHDGYFRSLTTIGQTDKWLVALNASSTIFPKIPLRPYASLALFPSGPDNDITTAAEIGISLSFLPEILEVSFPIATTTNIADNLEIQRPKYFERISFVMNLNKAMPHKLVQEISNF